METTIQHVEKVRLSKVVKRVLYHERRILFTRCITITTKEGNYSVTMFSDEADTLELK